MLMVLDTSSFFSSKLINILLWVHVLELYAQMAKEEGTVSPFFWNRWFASLLHLILYTA